MLSMSECPSHIWTVRRSTPFHKCRVANVALNLWSQKLSSSRFGTLRDGLQIIQKIHLYVAPRGRKHERACLIRFRLPRLQTLDQLCRDGNLALFICLWRPSSIPFVADPNCRMREVHIGDQYVCMTSCSRIPVIRKNSYQSLSSSSQAAKSVSSSSSSYISGSSSVYRGQSFLPDEPPNLVRF